MDSSQSSRITPESTSTSPPLKFNLSWGLLAIVMTVAAGVLAHWQPPYPYPATPVSERSWMERLLYPREANGELRLWQPARKLNSIAASANGQYLLAVGDSGAALFSDDSGRHWRSQVSGLTENLTYAWISDDGKQGGAVTFSGSVYEMRPDSGAWTPDTRSSGIPIGPPQLPSPSPYFNNRSPRWPQGMPPGTQIERSPSKDASQTAHDSLWGLVVSPVPTDCKHAWAIGDFGSIVTSEDCGKTWKVQASALPGSLFAITFLADGKRGWAAGYAGVLLRTTDAGEHWLPTTVTDIHSTVTSIMFLENGHGWMVTENGELLSSTDLGRSWRLIEPQPQLPGLRCVYFQADGLRGRITNDEGASLSTADGGLTWTSVARDKPADLHTMTFSPDGLKAPPKAKDGTMVSNDCGSTWRLQPTPDVEITATATYSTGNGFGWMAGEDGQMVASVNGAVQKSYSPARSTRLAMWFSDANNGWAVGLHPALTRTRDGGKTWAIVPTPIQYSRSPAPWFWALLPLIAWMWMRAFQTRRPPVEEGVATMAASDAPTQDFCQDRLRFGPLAKGISRFLRNEATEPPLTLAVSGDWGTGKSSLMTLICKDLRNNGCRPVWFNAWHHQKDEQLLAALLSAVREQSLPSFFEPSGWIFRWRLLVLRTKRHWFVASLLALSGVWLGAYLSAHEAGQWQSLWTLLDKASATKEDGITLAFLGSLNLGPLAAKLAGLVTAFVALRKTLTAFGADPAVLLSNSVEQFRLKEANALTSFRSRFAKEFEEVTQCLPGRLVVVIDDLDRCRAEAVLEVMEAVNFLVSSGKCFVIFGMATNRVQAALALSFEKIAQEMTELDTSSQAPLTAEAKAELERMRRRKYARDYLEKLINLEIAVPDTPSDKPHSLLEETADDSTPQTALFKRLKIAVTAVLCAAALGYAWHSGQHYQLPLASAQAYETTTNKTAATPPASVPDDKKQGSSAPPETNLDSAVRANPFPPNEALDTRNDIAFTVVSIILLLVTTGLTYALWRLRRTLYRVQDSPAFKASLVAWSPLVQKHRRTPRALKRFANRLRYLAMLQQAQRFDQSGWDILPRRLREWLGLTVASESSAAEASIAEHRIVALGALYEVFGSDWKNCAKDHLPESELAELAKLSIKAYCAPGLGVTWPPSEEEIQRFAQSLAGVRIPS